MSTKIHLTYLVFDKKFTQIEMINQFDIIIYWDYYHLGDPETHFNDILKWTQLETEVLYYDKIHV